MTPSPDPTEIPAVKCDCPDWELGSTRMNAPALTMQARNPGSIPAGYFITFRFCPWCGKTLSAQSQAYDAAPVSPARSSLEPKAELLSPERIAGIRAFWTKYERHMDGTVPALLGHIAALESQPASLVQRDAERDENERVLRMGWWLSHGCPFAALYGDDGEMQCNACQIDFKRWPPRDIEIRLKNVRMLQHQSHSSLAETPQ